MPTSTLPAPTLPAAVVPAVASTTTGVVPTTVSPSADVATALAAGLVDITSEGYVAGSSEDASGTFPDLLAVDHDPTTSWFSANAADDECTQLNDSPCSYLDWFHEVDEDPTEVPITQIVIVGNQQNTDPARRNECGFGSVLATVQTTGYDDVYEERFQLDGNEPGLTIYPDVIGGSVNLVFFGFDSPACSGIADIYIFTAPSGVTPPPPPVTTPPATVNIAAQGSLYATTDDGTSGFPIGLVVDGDPTTSWFAGPEQICSDGTDDTCDSISWDYNIDDDPDPKDILIVDVNVTGNQDNTDPARRTGCGFTKLTIALINSAGDFVYQEHYDLVGDETTVTAHPNVAAATVYLFFQGRDTATCAGFAELEIIASGGPR